MKNPHPEIEVLFISPNQKDAEECFNYLKTSGHFEEFYTIIPKYYIAGKGEAKLEARENMIIVFHADSKEDFDKIKPDIYHFQNCKYRCLFSNKEDAKKWMEEFHDHGIRILIGMKQDSLNYFKDLIIFFLKAHGGWKEGHIPHHKEHQKKQEQHHEMKGEQHHHLKEAKGENKDVHSEIVGKMEDDKKNVGI